ncbi:hypothetical protein Tco_0059478 [Tanacetum coccineum]
MQEKSMNLIDWTYELAKGFVKKKVLDFEESFAPVCSSEHSDIHWPMTPAKHDSLSNGRENCILNGELIEEVYVHQQKLCLTQNSHHVRSSEESSLRVKTGSPGMVVRTLAEVHLSAHSLVKISQLVTKEAKAMLHHFHKAEYIACLLLCPNPMDAVSIIRLWHSLTNRIPLSGDNKMA